MIAWLLAVGWVHAAPPITVWSADLQGSDGGLESGGDPGQWAWGTIEAGPGEGIDGPQGWATRLDRVHMNNADDRLTLPQIDITGRDHPVLVLTHWYDFEPGDDDFGQVERWDGDTWTALPSLAGPMVFDGSSEGWRTDYYPLSDADIDRLDALRLRFFADAAVARDGWVVGAMELVDGDPVPPEVTIDVAPEDTQDIPGPHVVEARVQDNVAVETVRLVWFAGAGERAEVELEEASPGVYVGGLPGAEPGTSFVWWVEAVDAAENVGVSDTRSFRVYLPAPTDLTAPEGRVVDSTVPLEWTAPITLWDIDHYDIYRDGEVVATSVDTTVEAPVATATDSFTVSAHFATDDGDFEGDQSRPVSVAAYPPAILRVAPAAAWPGDTLNVVVQGRYLLLEAGSVEVDVGPEIDVLDVEVIDVDTLEVQLRLGPGADPGTRAIDVTSGVQWVTADGAFEVRTDATRPRIEATAPGFLVRGARDTLRVRTNVPLPDDPRLDLGPGVVVEKVRIINDYTAEFTVAVARDAPLDNRIPELDIGNRLLVGPPLSVRAPQPTTETNCATVAAPVAWLGWLLPGAAAVWFRRRKDSLTGR